MSEPIAQPAVDAIERIQRILREFFPEVQADGDVGKITRAALAKLDEMGDMESLKTAPIPLPDAAGRHTVVMSSFADLADVAAFRRCKAAGGSDNLCFGKGDNGIGAWGANTAQEDVPMVALPREVWRAAGKTGGAGVLVEFCGRQVRAVLGDTMPALENIHNGAGMDANPATVKALGLKAPVMQPGVVWSWI